VPPPPPTHSSDVGADTVAVTANDGRPDADPCGRNIPVTDEPIDEGAFASVQMEPDAKFCSTVIFMDFAPPERNSANVWADLPDLPSEHDVVSVERSSPFRRRTY